jgi:hypothetical protein
MIQYDKDGITLFYIDANGNRVAYGPFAGQVYTDMLTVRSAQQAAGVANALAVANYNNVLANVQISVSAGRGDTVTAPAKPLQMVVADPIGPNDQPVVTYVPFVPPLADIVPLVTIPSAGIIAQPSLDKQTIMYNMISAMYNKEFPSS